MQIFLRFNENKKSLYRVTNQHPYGKLVVNKA